MRKLEDLTLFALSSSRSLGERIARALEVELAAHEEREFEDGEHKCRSLVEVRGRDIYVVQSLFGDARLSANDKLCRLLFFLGSLRDAGAERLTAIVPYLCYSRKDRRSKARDPVTTRYVARMFEAIGVDRVVTIDVHNLAAFENAFGARARPENLSSRSIFIEYFRNATEAELAVVSPDIGGVKRSEPFRLALAEELGRSVAGGVFTKERSQAQLRFGPLSGDVRGKKVVIVDDIVATGSTLIFAATACREAGAVSVSAAVTHGAFVKGAEQRLVQALDELVVTDTIESLDRKNERLRRTVKVLGTGAFLAEAIRRLHTNGSIAELMDG